MKWWGTLIFGKGLTTKITPSWIRKMKVSSRKQNLRNFIFTNLAFYLHCYRVQQLEYTWWTIILAHKIPPLKLLKLRYEVEGMEIRSQGLMKLLRYARHSIRLCCLDWTGIYWNLVWRRGWFPPCIVCWPFISTLYSPLKSHFTVFLASEKSALRVPDAKKSGSV